MLYPRQAPRWAGLPLREYGRIRAQERQKDKGLLRFSIFSHDFVEVKHTSVAPSQDQTRAGFQASLGSPKWPCLPAVTSPAPIRTPSPCTVILGLLTQPILKFLSSSFEALPSEQAWCQGRPTIEQKTRSNPSWAEFQPAPSLPIKDPAYSGPTVKILMNMCMHE